MLLTSWEQVLKHPTKVLDLETSLRMDASSYFYDAPLRSKAFSHNFLAHVLDNSHGLSEGHTGRFTDALGRRLLLVNTFLGNVAFLERTLPPENADLGTEVQITCYCTEALSGIVREGQVTQRELYHYVNPFGQRNIGTALKVIRKSKQVAKSPQKTLALV